MCMYLVYVGVVHTIVRAVQVLPHSLKNFSRRWDTKYCDGKFQTRFVSTTVVNDAFNDKRYWNFHCVAA